MHHVCKRKRQVCSRRAFSLLTAMHFLRVERRLLTISLIYGIITAEKEFMRSRVFDFLMASTSHRNGLDHSFDHLQSWTTWKQCLQEHPKAPFSDSKAPKSLVNQGKNRCRFVWEHDVAGSNPVIPTKISRKQVKKACFRLIFIYFSQNRIFSSQRM